MNETVSLDRCLDDANRQTYIIGLNEAQDRLKEANVDYRIVGSLATASYIDNDGATINFNRPDATTLDQRVPDIDLIVPRDHLAAARICRESLMREAFPIKLGLAASSSTIDYLPQEQTSYLTHKTLKVPVSTALFEAKEQSLMSSKIITVDPKTLLHTYVTCGGRLRPKDRTPITNLAQFVASEENENAFTEADFKNFHNFIVQRRSNYPVSTAAHLGIGLALERMSPAMKNRVMRLALPVASALNMR